MLLETLKKEFIFDCEVRELSKRTIHNYEKQLNIFLRFLRTEFEVEELSDFKAIHVKSFISACQKRKSKPSYINDLLKAVKCFCNYIYREGYTEELITERVRNVKEPRVLIHTFSTEEIRRMIGYFNKDTYLDMRNKLILMILFDTGIRISELLEMKLEQIQDGYFVIYGKGRKERVVPKNAMVSKWLIKYLAEREQYFMLTEPKEYVFLSRNGKKLTEEAVRKMMVITADAVGVNSMVRVSPHTCRHTFAHQQLMNGLDLYSLSRILGHESVSITQKYLESLENSQVLTQSKRAGVLKSFFTAVR